MNSNWTYSPGTPNLGQILWFLSCDLEIWQLTFKNNRAPLPLCVSFHGHRSMQTGITVQKHPIWVKIDFSIFQFFRPCDREIWWMTSKNNRALLLYYVKLFASFQIHWWIQTGFTVQKGSIWVEIGDMLSRVTLKFDGWPWKTIGHLFYATSSFVQHFVPISEFKLELQSGNAQFGSKSMIFWAVWPSNLTDDLENNRAPLLCYFKLCGSFRTHWWIQTGVTVRKHPIWVKINDFLSRVTFKLDGWPWKTIGHLFYDTLTFVHHFNAIGKFKLKLKSGNAQLGSKSTIFLSVWPRNFTDNPEKQ